MSYITMDIGADMTDQIPLRRGRIETDSDPRREPVTISTDTLGHWPRELGSLDLDEARRKMDVIVNREIARLFENLFLFSDLEEWEASSARRRSPGNYRGIVINGA